MDKWKKQIGFVIEYHRQKQYGKTKLKEYAKETFATMMIDHKEIRICSNTTYRKLAQLEIIKNDDVYILLLSKLGFSYDENAFVYQKAFQQDCDCLLKYIEEIDYDKAAVQCENLLNQLGSDDVIEKIHALTLQTLHVMLLKKHMLYDLEVFKTVADMFYVLPDSLKQCLEIAIYNYCCETNDGTAIKKYFAMIPKTPYHRVHLLYYHIDESLCLDEVEDEMNALLEHYKENENQVLTLLLMKLKYYYLIGRDSDEALHEIDAYIKKYETKIAKHLKLKYLYFKAKKYNREKQYVQAKQLFEQLIHEDKDYLEYIMYYYFHCLVMLDEYANFDSQMETALRQECLEVYRYFQIEKEDYLKREQYLLHLLKDKNSFVCEFSPQTFFVELRKLVKKTKHYVLLDKYLEKIDVFN